MCSRAGIIGLFVLYADGRLRCSLFYKCARMLALLVYLSRIAIHASSMRTNS